MNRKYVNGLIGFWLAALVLINAWIMTESVLLIDSARDFSYALDIAQGRIWHLMGPEFGGFIHTGPVWFYLLALPLLSGSLSLAAFFIGCVAGLKFILAYYLGTQWVNRRFGVLWAACLLIPGWHSINYFIPGHINVIDTAVLAFVASLWQYHQSRQMGWLYLSGLLLALSMHAHVTALIVAVLYLPVLWRGYGDWRVRDVMWLGLLFTLPFMPYLWAQVLDGFGDWARWQALTQEVDQMRRGLSAQKDSFMTALFGNVYALLVTGMHRIYGFVASVKAIWGSLFMCLVALLLAVIMTHWGYRLVRFRKPLKNQLKPLLLGIILLLLGVAMITALRSFTPFYMLFVLTPLLAFLWAWLLSVGGQLPIPVNAAVVIAVLLLGALPILALQKAVYDDQVHLGPLGNVRQMINEDWQTDFNTLDALTVSDAEVWAHYLCQNRIQLHGPGAAVLDLLSALPVRLSCPDKTVYLGGKPQIGYQQVLLMHRSFWHAARREPDQWLTPAWGLTKDMTLHNQEPAFQPIDFNDYVHPPRQRRATQPVQTLTRQLYSDGQAILVISHLLPFYTQNSVLSVRANGHKAENIMANIGNSLYYCATCQSGPIQWQITLRSNDPQALDIMTL